MSYYLIQQIAGIDNIKVRTSTEIVCGARRRAPGEADAAQQRLRRRRRRCRPVCCSCFIGAAPRTDWLDGAAVRDNRGLRRRRARPGRRRQTAGRLAAGPRPVPPGDQRARRLRRRRRPGRLGQAGGLRGRRGRDGRHLGAPVSGEAMTDRPSPPTQPPLRCSADELRTLFLFEKLTDEQLDWLCEQRPVEDFEPGPVYAEGDPATCFYVLLAGTLVLSRRVGAGRRRDHPHVAARRLRRRDRGPTSAATPRRPTTASMRAVHRRRFFVLDAPLFAQAMREWFPMAVHLLDGLFFGIKNTNERGRPAGAAAGPGLPVGRADPRAEQPGLRGRPGHRRAAGAGRRDAAQAGHDRRRQDVGPMASSSR